MLLVFIVLAFGWSLQAQPSIGVRLKFEDTNQFKEDVLRLSEIGIRNFVISGKPGFDDFSFSGNGDLRFLMEVPIRMKTQSSLQHSNEELVALLTRYITQYKIIPQVSGFVITWACEPDKGELKAQQQLYDEVREQTPKAIYAVEPDPAIAQKFHYSGLRFYRFRNNGISDRLKSVLISPPFEQNMDTQDLQELLSQESLADHIIYLDDSYLDDNSNLDYLSKWLQDQRFLIAEISEANSSGQAGNWVSVLLLLIWMSYAAHFSYEPTYRKSIARFFFNHSFFANDVLNRHERIGISSFIVIMQSCLLVGLALEVYASYFLTDAARQILGANHLIFRVFNVVPWGYFLLGILICAMNILLGLLWLRFTLPGVKFLYQVTPLYSWFYHTLFLIIPVWVIAMKFPHLGFLVNLSAFATLFVLLGAFIVVVLDGVKQNPALRQQIFLRTLYPYVVLVLLFGYFILYPTGFYSSLAFANEIAMQVRLF